MKFTFSVIIRTPDGGLTPLTQLKRPDGEFLTVEAPDAVEAVNQMMESLLTFSEDCRAMGR